MCNCATANSPKTAIFGAVSLGLLGRSSVTSAEVASNTVATSVLSGSHSRRLDQPSYNQIDFSPKLNYLGFFAVLDSDSLSGT